MPPIRLGSLDGKPFEVDADLLVTGRTCVLGASGSGKSYAVGVVCEELCKSHVPFALVDTEGEHSGLKQKYEVVWVGEDEGCDLNWRSFDPAEAGRLILDAPPILLDVSETDNPQAKVGRLVSAVYEQVSIHRTPYLLIVEEADKFVPQFGDRVQIIGEVARRGRKRGLGIMVCTQRPSLVDKNVLSQCSNQLIGKLVLKNDLQAVEQFFPGRGLPEQLTSMPPGFFYAAGGFSAMPVCVKIRERETPHGGSAPKLGEPSKRTALVSEWLRATAVGQRREESTDTVPDQEVGYRQTSQPVRQIGSDASLDNGVSAIRLGLPALISASDAALIVKRERSFPLFGQEETVSSIQMVMRPLVQLGIRTRVRAGLLKWRFETRFALFDGVTGRQVDVSNTLALKEGLERLIGLGAEEVTVLKSLETDSYLGVVDLALKTGLSDRVVRSHLVSLEKKRLAGSRRVGRTKVFYRVVDIPEIKQNERNLQIEEYGSMGDAQIERLAFTEPQLREVIKGLIEDSEVELYQPFLYPMYRVELVLKDRVRTEWVDARSGKTIDFQ
jgi:DNA-binding transcriptional ArsR family regulator